MSALESPPTMPSAWNAMPEPWNPNFNPQHMQHMHPHLQIHPAAASPHALPPHHYPHHDFYHSQQNQKPDVSPMGGNGLNTSSDSGSSSNGSGNNNTKSSLANPTSPSSSSIAAPPQHQKRTVNFKLEIKQDPNFKLEIKQEGSGPLDIGGGGDTHCVPQKVPSISDLSEAESSLDLPNHQVSSSSIVYLLAWLVRRKKRRCKVF
jgi:hypothetical protein